MSASNFLELELLDHVLGAATYTPPVTVYISLHTADPGETGANEVSGNAYARVAVTNNATNWPAAAAGLKSNGIVFTFPTPTGAGWGTVTHFGIWDAASAGNNLFGGALSVPKTINADDTVQFNVGDIDITAD